MIFKPADGFFVSDGALGLNALALLAKAETDNASKFIRTAMLGPDADAALHCATKSANPADWAQCMPFREATWKWAEDAAAGGSFFQRIMFHGMNALFFIWICLAPVVATVMLMMGVRGIRLAGSYLLFGAWTVSWYVGASIVNFYVTKQVQYEFDMLGSVGGMKLEGVRMLLGAGGVLETKIALSGEMLAQVPLLMMAVMSGSVYGLTALAQRFSGRDYYDESRNVPAARGSAPIFESMGRFGQAYGGVVVDRGIGAGGSFDFTTGADYADQNSLRSERVASSTLMNGIGNSITQSWEHGKAGEEMKAFGQNLAAQGFAGMSVTDSQGRTYTLEKTGGWKRAEKHFEKEDAGTDLSAGGGIGLSAGARGGGKSTLGANYSADQSKRAGEETSNTEEEGYGRKGSRATGVGAEDRSGSTFTRNLSSDDVAKIGKTFRETAGHQYQRAFGDNKQLVESFVNSGGKTHTVKTAFGGKTEFTAQETAQRIQDMGLSGALGRYTDERAGWSAEAQKMYALQERNARREFQGIGEGQAKEDLIKARALQRTAVMSGESGAQQAWANFSGQFAGADVSHVKPVSSYQAETNSGKAIGWEDEASRGGTVVGPDEAKANQKTSTVGQNAKDGAVKVVKQAGEDRTQAAQDAERRSAAAAQAQKGVGSDPGQNDFRFRPSK